MKSKVFSVTQINTYIKRMFQSDYALRRISIKGQVSNCKYHSSGHIYFSLKDDNSKINCIMFKSKIYDLDFVLKEGMAVIVSGRAAVYTANGTFQLYCNTIQQEGLGELHIRFERLKEKLSREGYFDAEVKKNLPKNPERIG